MECSNGDLIASWYGDVRPNDSAVFGARKRHGETAWDAPFVMANRPGFPDCNTAMNIDRRGRLWLFWPTILASSWESSLLNYQIATDYLRPGPPKWDERASSCSNPPTLAKSPSGYSDRVKSDPPRGAIVGTGWSKGETERPALSALGWAPRCKPTILPSGRIVLPVYSDTFSISIMALSDDEGKSWYPSKPLIGFGNIQPTVLRRDDATLVAYMRENGPLQRIRVSESKDDGISWGPVNETELPNPGSGIDGVRLANGRWVLVYNDSQSSRSTLAVSLSDDEGRTWKWTRHLERHKAGRFHYPAMIQGRDGSIHAIYSCFIASDATPAKSAAGKSDGAMLKGIKHAMFNEAWIRAGD